VTYEIHRSPHGRIALAAESVDHPSMATPGDLIARNVRVERARRRWRQADLAEQLGWSEARVGALESGQRRVTFDQVVELCKAFEIPLVQLLADAEQADLNALGL
jgi:transcriptional regulator with XRE-family HTH domain